MIFVLFWFLFLARHAFLSKVVCNQITKRQEKVSGHAAAMDARDAITINLLAILVNIAAARCVAFLLPLLHVLVLVA